MYNINLILKNNRLIIEELDDQKNIISRHGYFEEEVKKMHNLYQLCYDNNININKLIKFVDNIHLYTDLNNDLKNEEVNN